MVVFLCLAAINILAYANTRQLQVHQGCRILNYPGTLSRNLKVGYGTNKEVCFDPQEDIFYCPGDSVCCPERRKCCPKYHPLCVGLFCFQKALHWFAAFIVVILKHLAVVRNVATFSKHAVVLVIVVILRKLAIKQQKNVLKLLL